MLENCSLAGLELHDHFLRVQEWDGDLEETKISLENDKVSDKTVFRNVVLYVTLHTDDCHC